MRAIAEPHSFTVAGSSVNASSRGYDKRAHIFHGTITAAAVGLWLRK